MRSKRLYWISFLNQVLFMQLYQDINTEITHSKCLQLGESGRIHLWNCDNPDIDCLVTSSNLHMLLEGFVCAHV